MTFDGTTFLVTPIERLSVKEFIETNHYSHSINGLRTKQCFALLDMKNEGKIIGAALFGALGMANNWKKFSDSESSVLELHRLVCIDDTPKNTESYFISRCLRWLKQNTDIKTVVSYADENHNHKGTIYRASNFKYAGTTKPSKMILYGDKMYHDKTIRTKYKGELKPFAKRISDALQSGEAKYVQTKFKHIYTYDLTR